MKKTFAGAFRRVITILIALIIGISVYSFNANVIVGNPLPMPFGIGAAVVLSGSMEPTLSVDDFVLIKKQKSYEVGDIVVYQEEDYIVIHRIMGFDGTMVHTKGDANNAMDEPVQRYLIKGKMILCIPGIGRAIQMIKSPAGVIGILALALGLMELSYRKDKKQSSEELKAIKDEILQLKRELENEEEK